MKPCFNKSAATITKNQEIIKRLNKQFPIDQDNITDIRLNRKQFIKDLVKCPIARRYYQRGERKSGMDG